MEFIIIELEIKIDESGSSARRWGDILEPSLELKKLITTQPRDQDRVKVLMQEVATSVQQEFRKGELEIEFSLEGLERL